MVAAIAGGIVVATIAAMLASTIPTSDYSLNVDALKDEQSLFTNARVVLTNTGRQELTNIVIDYGASQQEKVGSLAPGEKAFRSPPEGSPLDSVTVTADHGIKVVQQYRKPIKLPGMIGS
ncbi:hypothetical protein [Nitrososphaera sp.]|uniref:hypothetical protein n=1 Tax=Nitrososphaera sp. TaxID=1971748 RepID=UPI00307CE510